MLERRLLTDQEPSPDQVHRHGRRAVADVGAPAREVHRARSARSRPRPGTTLSHTSRRASPRCRPRGRPRPSPHAHVRAQTTAPRPRAPARPPRRRRRAPRSAPLDARRRDLRPRSSRRRSPPLTYSEAPGGSVSRAASRPPVQDSPSRSCGPLPARRARSSARDLLVHVLPSLENSVSAWRSLHNPLERLVGGRRAGLVAGHHLDLAAFQAGRDLQPLELDALALGLAQRLARSPTPVSRRAAACAAR